MLKNRSKIAIIYTHFPHYRSAVFDELDKSNLFDFEFYYDPCGINKTIESGTARNNHKKLRTYKFKNFYVQPGVLKIIFRGDIDAFVFLGNSYILSTWLAALILRLRKKRILFWTHGWLNDEKGMKGTVRNIFYSLSDTLLLYGERAKNIGLKKGFSPKKLHVINNSLDYQSQLLIRQQIRETKSELKTPYFLSVTRLISGIELNLAIAAVKEASLRSSVDFEFIIVGDGPLRLELVEQAKNLQVKVHFLGAIYDEVKLAELFYDCLAVVSPGKVGLLAMHALAYGAPVITHDDLNHQMPEAEAVIPGVTGALFNRGDKQSLANLLLDFLNEKYLGLDPSTSISLIEKKYTPSVQCKLIERALTQNLSGI